jgi:serine/threonine protein kinase
MPLSPARIHRGRPTPYPWEREALDLIYAQLSDVDPYQAWELHELHDASSGRLYELDLLFLSRVGLFLVEIKSHPGTLTGDLLDWTFTDTATGRPIRRSIECPYSTLNHKARVLGSLLDRLDLPHRPYVHPVVFTPNVTSIQLDGGRPPWLLLRDDIATGLTYGLDDRVRNVVNRPTMKALVQAAQRLGLRQSRASRIVAGYHLETLLDEGEGYQEHLAHHPSVDSDRARIRSYLVPAATSSARRTQLERAARREAQTLSQLGQHPGILGYRTFVEEAPLGPAVVFEPFDGAVALHTFLRQEPNLSFDERLQILQSIVEAVAHCHRAGVLHRNLSPASVLVRRTPGGTALQVRLHRFQTSTWIDHSSQGTRHVAELAQAIDRLYLAPEILSDAQKAVPESDIFSVGCLAWLLLTGQPPAPTLAERDERLRSHPATGLQPSTLRPDLASLDEGLAFATAFSPLNRPDDVAEWFEGWVLDAITRPPAEPSTDLDPHQAQKGDLLPGGLRVERRLGMGGTALVLHVRRDGRDFALKVPHDALANDRLLAEAATLRDLRHEHIVALHGVVTLSSRPCLLLDFAGERTLADLLRAEGSLSLEHARRYGDDLLSAVQYLEERGITHRDIKPSNVGFTGYEGRQKHLLLLDFSLSSADPSAVSAGTAEWRDPWLYLRGRWDAAADRFAAALVLYQALTGARPTQAQATHDDLLIDAERFDPAVRDRLAEFFQRAFARDPAARFDHAEDMRQAWARALSPGESRAQPNHHAATFDLDTVRPDTPIDALPLSARAKNALDRAAVPLVSDLLQLPRNQLSMVRGIGSKVTKEIFALAERLRSSLETTAPAPLIPGFIRPRLTLDDPELGLAPAALQALSAAGLTSSVDVAQTPQHRLVHLIGADATTALADRLRTLQSEEPAPGSLAAWVRTLVGRASETEASRRLRLLVGLDPLPGDAPANALGAARSVPEVAQALGIDPAPIHASLQFLRTKRWADNETALALVDALGALMTEPAMTLPELARAFAATRIPDGEPSQDDLTNAAALVRVALELRPTPLCDWRRLHGTAWLAKDREVLDALPALGSTADQLAATEPLPSTEAVRQALLQAVADTPLASLPSDQRVTLAARVSRTAAASIRLEIYPSKMEAERALRLSLSALTSDDLRPETVRRRVAARYPEALPLPERPELDTLLARYGLIFNVDLGEYARPGPIAPTSMTVQAPPRATTAAPSLPARRDPDAQRALAFQDQLDRGVASRRFRVIQVRADLALIASQRLAETLGVAPVSLDHTLIHHIRSRAQQDEVDWSAIIEADRAGPTGPQWSLLVGLVRDAAEAMVDALLSRSTWPLILIWPGVLARYGLGAPLQRLVERAEHSEEGGTGAVLLLLPSHNDGLPPSINSRLPVPAPFPGQRLQMPEPWLANAHRASELSP